MNEMQKSIAKTRAAMHELGRLVGVVARQKKIDTERANANLEHALDEICAETNLKPTPENYPTIVCHLEQILRDQEKRRAEREQGPEEDSGAMKDFPW